MDFRYVRIAVTRTFDDLGPGDLFQDEEESGSDEEHPEYRAVKNEEDPEGDVQHVCPVENLGVESGEKCEARISLCVTCKVIVIHHCISRNSIK